LWPIFGVTNQLLAGLAFLVVCFYLIIHRRRVWFLIGPTILMIVVPAWALLLQLFGETGWVHSHDPTKRYLLSLLGLATLILQAWMVLEAALMWQRAKGVVPDPLPPLGTVQRGVAC
ncbi:MAG: carbon starvation CstA 5TM domain-containing protein, partial [Phycisphaerae bacterium]